MRWKIIPYIISQIYIGARGFVFHLDIGYFNINEYGL